MKIYCKNCMYYPRLTPKFFARCKIEDIKTDWYTPEWVRRYCEIKNMGNDCEDYEGRKARNVNKEK